MVEGNPLSAGGILDVNVNRENKALARNLTVSVTASVITAPSTSDGDVAEAEGLPFEQWVPLHHPTLLSVPFQTSQQVQRW